MGLDMNLYERQYCPSVYCKEKDKKTNFTTKVYNYDGTSKKTKFKNVAYIICRKGYWRKANEIHRFFLDRCTDNGNEWEYNGRDIVVSEEVLTELLNICQELLKLKGKKFKEEAKKKLPTSQGFFWGSYEYDKWYRQDLRNTIKILKSLDLPSKDYNIDFIYNANW